MVYKPQLMSDRFQMRLSQQDRDLIRYVMERENIPDAAKAIRYCVQQRAESLRRKEQRTANNGK